MLTIPNIESSPLFDAQSVPDSIDWAIQSAATSNTGVTSGGVVTVDTGMIVSVASGGGAYANTPFTWTAATPTVTAAGLYDRKDIVVVSSSGTVSIVAGSLCTTAVWNRNSTGFPPVKPAIPSNSIVLAEIYVASNTTSIASGNIIDKRGMTPVSGSATVASADGSMAITGSGTSSIGLTLNVDHQWYHTFMDGIPIDAYTDQGANLNSLMTSLTGDGVAVNELRFGGGICSSVTIAPPSSFTLEGFGWSETNWSCPTTNGDIHFITLGSANQLTQLKNFGILYNNAQTAGDWHSGIYYDVTTDSEFDPHNLIEHIWIKGAPGEGLALAESSHGESLVSDCWVQWSGGANIYTGAYDMEFLNCRAQNGFLSGWYVSSNAVDTVITNAKSYNNGRANVFAIDTAYAAGTTVVYSGAVYVAINAITNTYTNNPLSDTTNWAAPARPMNTAGTRGTQNACPDYGCGYYITGYGEMACVQLINCVSQQNTTNGIYIHDIQGVNYTGSVLGYNYNQTTGVYGTTNPNYYSAVVLDAASNNYVNISVANPLNGATKTGYLVRLINGSSGNEIHITTDGEQLAIFSPDTTAGAIQANTVWINGVLQIPLTDTVYTVAVTTSTFVIPGGYGQYNLTLNHTLGSTCTLTLPSVAAGQSFILALNQDSIGGVAWVLTGAKWPGRTAPTSTTTGSATDLVALDCVNGTSWFGSPSLNVG